MKKSYMRGAQLMHWQLSLITSIVVCGLWMPARGEQLKYYVWVDDNNVTHMEETPPMDRDYEVRIIDVDEGIPSPPSTSAPSSSTPGGATTTERPSSSPSKRKDEPSPDDLETAITDEEQRRLGSDSSAGQTGGNTAEGSTAATSGSVAPTSGAAATGSTAGTAATAPAATLPPAGVGP